MSAAIAIWSLHIPAGKKIVHVPQADIRITGASLDAALADKDGRASIKLTYVNPQKADEDDDDEKPLEKTTVVLASLTPSKIEQAHLDLIISEEEPVEFEIIGKNSIYLSGNYILQPSDFPAAGKDEDDEDDEDEDEEESFDLREVSSDVEVNEDEIDIPSSEEEDISHRFEEVIEEPDKEEKAEAPAKKRPHEDEAEEQKLSKKQRKKLKQQDAEPATKGADVKEKKEVKTEEDEKERAKKGTAKPKAELETRPSGLQIKDVKEGTGKTVKSGDRVRLRYVGKFKDGKVFDSNTKGKPFTFRVGAGEVIKGWDEGIQGMKFSGERLLIVPAKLGYGNKKQSDIPPGSTLYFEIKLLEIK